MKIGIGSVYTRIEQDMKIGIGSVYTRIEQDMKIGKGSVNLRKELEELEDCNRTVVCFKINRIRRLEQVLNILLQIGYISNPQSR